MNIPLQDPHGRTAEQPVLDIQVDVSVTHVSEVE